MKPAFYIVDDDLSIRRILTNIIDDYNLGYVIGESSDGDTAIEEIIDIVPDVVLVDLLLPSIDGIEIVKKIKEKKSNIQFIMISQVASKDMIAEAYKSGIEYYINKPINVIEVISVIEKVVENLKLRQVLSMIGKTLEREKLNFTFENKESNKEYKAEIVKIFSDLGILGEAGSNDLLYIIEMIIEERRELSTSIHNYKISDMYKRLNRKYMEEKKEFVSIKALEQRIRRIIQSALENIASIGIEDYGNMKFEKYSTSLFDFKEVKNEMDYIREKSKNRGKINVKKFIEGIISHLNN
ncbi:response regulator [Caminicella sporogenes]|uniref:response regulator n=1 Tax=Caminicella sporogenes TaxID=166485 RepID=UPI0025402DBE|nr:response regulator [Caminicella sporogenes]WIF94137.1 response regulator [Caminicella sporogenes]